MKGGGGEKGPLWISVPHYTVEGQRTTILIPGAIEPNLSFRMTPLPALYLLPFSSYLMLTEAMYAAG